ncbi:MAG TPA: long-chain fatty acid--CoA ligase [Bacteroidales bacterium]|jgi:long-chain acyl-CoA synthetase|nr:long-chain fatty acid--CoA ligase [Bacteroidales bacterium]
MIPENFIKYIENSLKKNWDLPALTDYQGESYKYQDVGRKIARIHIMFEECEIKKGDKIALIGKNSANWAMAYLAIITYGATVVPILPDFLPNDVHHIVNHSDSVVLFTGDPIWENLDEKSMPNLRGIFSLTDFRILIEGNKENIKKIYDKLDQLYEDIYPGGITSEKLSFDEVSNEEIGVLNYTSGTTGFSKGVVLPLNSLAANVRFAHRNMPLNSGDKIVSFLPLAHTYGCAFEFLWPFTIGCHIHFLTRTPSPKIIIQAFQEVKPAIIITVPLIMEKIYKKQILPILGKKSMQFLLTLPLLDKAIYNKIKNKLTDVFGGNFKEVVLGGAALNSEVELFLNKIKFNYSVGYGMTECGPLISYANWDKTKFTSSGKMVDTLEVKIDSNDPYNEVGEIMVRGENVMYGYYKNVEATEQAIDKDGWLHTGDLGIIDSENFVFIKGRNKSLLLGPSGENIYPEEIEAKLNNMPYIQESVVIEKDGKLVALVYPDLEATDQEKINEARLIEIMEENKKEVNLNLAKYMQITKVKIFPEEFEKTPKRSIKRYLYATTEL